MQAASLGGLWSPGGPLLSPQHGRAAPLTPALSLTGSHSSYSRQSSPDFFDLGKNEKSCEYQIKILVELEEQKSGIKDSECFLLIFTFLKLEG